MALNYYTDKISSSKVIKHFIMVVAFGWKQLFRSFMDIHTIWQKINLKNISGVQHMQKWLQILKQAIVVFPQLFECEQDYEENIT